MGFGGRARRRRSLHILHNGAHPVAPFLGIQRIEPRGLLAVAILPAAPGLLEQRLFGFGVDLDAAAGAIEILDLERLRAAADLLLRRALFLLRGFGNFLRLFIHIQDAFDHIFHSSHTPFCTRQPAGIFSRSPVRTERRGEYLLVFSPTDAFSSARSL